MGGKRESSGELGHFWRDSIETVSSVGVHGSRNIESLAPCLEERAAFVFVGVDRLTDMERNWYMVVEVSEFLSLGTSRTVQV